MLGWFSARIFLGPAQRRLFARGVPVLSYHKIGVAPPGSADPFLYHSPNRFDEQLAALRRCGYASGTVAEVLPATADPARKAVITFDDGCCNVLENGLAPLARHQFRAIQFLVSNRLGLTNDWDVAKGDVPERLMNATQVQEWLAAGHLIGSHSATHRNLRHLPAADAREEIVGSKKALEDKFGVEVTHFCYPYGSWNAAVRDLVAEAGYATACTMEFGINAGGRSPFELRRVIPLSSAETLAKILHRLRRKLRSRP